MTYFQQLLKLNRGNEVWYRVLNESWNKVEDHVDHRIRGIIFSRNTITVQQNCWR